MILSKGKLVRDIEKDMQEGKVINAEVTSDNIASVDHKEIDQVRGEGAI